VNPLLLNAFNDELEKISFKKEASFFTGVGKAAKHLGGGIGHALKGFGKGAPKNSFRRAVRDIGKVALNNKKLTGQIGAGVAGAGLLGTGAVLS
jgi:hypothetical protein